jgi:hypothetical protein
LLDEFCALEDAEFVLLIDDGEAEVVEAGALVKQRVGADDDLRAGWRCGALGAGLADYGIDPCAVIEEGHRGLGAFRAGAQGDVEAERAEPALAIEVMLFGEDLRGGHEGGLRAGFDAKEHGGKGDQRFAGADVAVE